MHNRTAPAGLIVVKRRAPDLRDHVPKGPRDADRRDGTTTGDDTMKPSADPSRTVRAVDGPVVAC